MLLRVSLNGCGWPWPWNPPVSASQVTEITGVQRHALMGVFLNKAGKLKIIFTLNFYVSRSKANNSPICTMGQGTWVETER